MARKGSNIVYDGENISFKEFYNEFGYDASMYLWDEVQQARAIVFCLDGKALEAYNSLTQDEKRDIQQIFKKLKELCVKPASHYLNTFNTRTIKYGETIPAFCHIIEELIDKAMPGLQIGFRKQLSTDRLMKSVPSNTRNFIELVIDKEWKEIVKSMEKNRLLFEVHRVAVIDPE